MITDSRTPLLVDTSTTFDAYLSRLSKTDRKKYKKNQKDSEGCVYTQIDYSPRLLRDFISLWEKQIVYGGHPKWCFTMEYMDNINTLVMFKVERKGVEGIHFIERCGNYAYAHPPLYDKSSPELSRFMWFGTIRWCCENGIDYFDLGAGASRTWQQLIGARLHKGNDIILNRIAYKWHFVPKDVKENPIDQLPVYQLRCKCGWKQLGVIGDNCARCG